MNEVSIEEIADTGALDFKTRAMLKSVELLYTNDEYIPTLLLIACAVDAISGGEKSKYLNFLEVNFPELCLRLGSLTFYTYFRNGMAHIFMPKNGYGIDRDSSMGGNYVEEIIVKETRQKIITINIDRLYDDFVKAIQKHNGTRKIEASVK